MFTVYKFSSSIAIQNQNHQQLWVQKTYVKLRKAAQLEHSQTTVLSFTLVCEGSSQL